MILDVALGIILAGILVAIGVFVIVAICGPFSLIAAIFEDWSWKKPYVWDLSDSEPVEERLARIRRGEPELKVRTRTVPIPE